MLVSYLYSIFLFNISTVVVIHSFVWCQYSNEEFMRGESIFPLVVWLCGWYKWSISDSYSFRICHITPTLKLTQEVICRASLKYNWSLIQYNAMQRTDILPFNKTKLFEGIQLIFVEVSLYHRSADYLRGLTSQINESGRVISNLLCGASSGNEDHSNI